MPEDSETFGISAERKNKYVSLEFYASENTLKKPGKIKLKEKKKVNKKNQIIQYKCSFITKNSLRKFFRSKEKNYTRSKFKNQ